MPRLMTQTTQTQDATPPETPAGEENARAAAPDFDSIEEGDENDGRDPKQVRWNLGAFIVDVVFFSFGMVLLDPSTIMPVLLQGLGAGEMLIGAYPAVKSLSFNAIQIFVAYGMHGRAQQKPFLAWIATLTRIPLLFLPFILWQASVSEAARVTALVSTILILCLWALGDGLGYVPWMEIIARGFSERTRGRFFTATGLLSGIGSVGVAALITAPILNAKGLPFPHNFAVIAMLSALMMMLSLAGVLLIREPPAPKHLPARPPLKLYSRQIFGLLRSNPVFLRLCATQLLIGFGNAAAPFYVLYALNRYRLDEGWAGKYQIIQSLGMACLVPLWTMMSEKRSPAAAVKAVSLACLLTPLAALTVGGVSPWAFGLVFVLLGGCQVWGLWIAVNHYLLSHVRQAERPIFIALLNLLFAPSALFPLLGGLVVKVAGVPALLALTAAVIACGAALAMRLPEPEGERANG